MYKDLKIKKTLTLSVVEQVHVTNFKALRRHKENQNLSLELLIQMSIELISNNYRNGTNTIIHRHIIIELLILI